MGDDELDDVEAAIGRKFPAAYRRFIRTYSPAEGARCGVYLYAHPKDLLRANRLMERRPDEHMVRERDGAGGWLTARPWPADWLVIGDGDTEWYAFLRPDDGGVWEWQHDSLEVARVARSLRSMMTEARKKAGPSPVPAEPVPTSHPTLGQLLWRPDRRKWTGSLKAGPGEEVKLFIEPDRDGAEAFLAVAAEAVPAARAVERSVFAAALADGAWERYVECDAHPSNGLAGVTMDTFRDRMRWWGLTVEQASDGPRLTYHYAYKPLERPSIHDLELFICARATDHAVLFYHWLL